jgi:hypothetical protein
MGRWTKDLVVSTITVDLDCLRVAAARVDDVATALDRASRQLARVGIDAIGHPRLTRAVDEFVAEWEYAADRIAVAAAHTGQRLRVAAQTYAATDNAVRETAGGGR